MSCDNKTNWFSSKDDNDSQVESEETKQMFNVQYEKFLNQKIDSKCGAEANLVLCKTYPSKEALLADPNVQKFGFIITIDEVEVKQGLKPALKYRALKDGSVARG
jgi:hypothetical protein